MEYFKMVALRAYGENTTLSNRIAVKADGVLVLLGYKKESKERVSHILCK